MRTRDSLTRFDFYPGCQAKSFLICAVRSFMAVMSCRTEEGSFNLRQYQEFLASIAQDAEAI